TSGARSKRVSAAWGASGSAVASDSRRHGRDGGCQGGGFERGRAVSNHDNNRVVARRTGWRGPCSLVGQPGGSPVTAAPSGVSTIGEDVMSRTTTTPPARQRFRVAALALMIMLLCAAPIALAQAPDLKLTPGVTVVGDGGTMRFVPVYDPDGSGPALQQYPDGSQLAWHSSDLSVLLIDQTGLALGRQPGTATVTATYGALTANAQVTVAGTLDQHSLQTPDGRTRTYLLYVPE